MFAIRRRHTRWPRDWSSDVCSSDLHRSKDPLQLFAAGCEEHLASPWERHVRPRAPVVRFDNERIGQLGIAFNAFDDTADVLLGRVGAEGLGTGEDVAVRVGKAEVLTQRDRKSTRLNSS